MEDKIDPRLEWQNKMANMWEQWIENSKINEFENRVLTTADVLDTWRFRYPQYVKYFQFAFEKWQSWVEPSVPTLVLPSTNSSSEEIDEIVYQKIEEILRTKNSGQSDEFYESATSDLAVYGSVKLEDRLIGYDFCVGYVNMPPLIDSCGGFFTRYAHVLPALFLNRFIEKNTVTEMQYSVICHGFKYVVKEIEHNQTYADEMASNLIKSDAFREVLRTWYGRPMIDENGVFISGSKFDLDWSRFRTRRVCIWLMTDDHVFAVIWEKQGNLDIVYPMDNYHKNPYRRLFIQSFIKCIESIKEGDFSLRKHSGKKRFVDLEHYESFVTDDDVPTGGRLACVSFMARCSAFLCSFYDYKKFIRTNVLEQLGTPRLFSVAYRIFEDKLFELLKREEEKGRCLWLPKVLNCKFLNINQVYLMSVNYDNKGIEIESDQIHYSFNGTGFSSWVDPESVLSGDCSLMSLYSPSPIPHCSLLKASALIADCGSIVAGMRLGWSLSSSCRLIRTSDLR